MRTDVSLLGPSRWKRGLAAVGAAALLGLAGCGGGGSGGAPDPGREPIREAGMDPASTLYRATFVGGFPAGTVGRALNASGQVAGIVSPDFQRGPGFFYDGAQLHTYETPGGFAPEVLDLSDAGRVVGSFTGAGDAQEAFSWTRAEGFVRIAPLSSKVHGSIAYDANEAGQVVGTLVKYDGSSQGFLWSAATGLVTRFGASGAQLASAYRINDAGLIAGEVVSGGRRRPVVLDAATGATTFVAPADAGSIRTIPLRPNFWLNNAGEVAGALDDGRAFFGRPLAGGLFVDLDPVVREGILRERPDHDPEFDTYVTALNESGQVLVNITHGVRTHFWSRADGFVGIWPPLSDDYSLVSLNRHGVAVGWSDPEFALAWSRGSGAIDLNPRVEGLPSSVRIRSATAINDRGVILGQAFDVFGEGSAAVLLVPVAGGASADRSVP